ncbi:MAG: aldehyde ferredoxin oxidoreductase [Candidatus Eisenbacteria sp.]|nr:aldehyde ferredoxin oxidoreductase [Candidatus Eisenbacteria bacterium]
MSNERTFRILIIHLNEGRGEVVSFGECDRMGGGSGLAAALYDAYGLHHEKAHHPDQPLIFAIGPLTGYFPLMSKVVCGFKSPYHDQYAESHAGGRMALALRFAGFDAIVIRGRAAAPSCIVVGSHRLQVDDVHHLWGVNVFTTGKLLRKMYSGHSGHRSILRIGPAGENGIAFGSINVDTCRHFGRLGAGSVMGGKNLKAIVLQGDETIALPEGKTYAKLFRAIYEDVTSTPQMRKYHDLGTPENLLPLNERKSLPWRNLQQTSDPGIEGISGERFAEELLLRQTACAGCPVGCIHMGMLRERFGDEHEYQYRQVSYDYEPIFAMGSMLGVTRAGEVLALLDEVERVGMDVMSTGVSLAWATEALEKGIIGPDETLASLAFGKTAAYIEAIHHLGGACNDFYRLLGQGTLVAAKHYGGEDYACVLGQEMAGYATGEVFFVAQSLGFRHSHLDTGGYSYDLKHDDKDLEKAVRFLIEDERDRCLLNSMVSCLFARGVYKTELLAEALASIGYKKLAGDLEGLAARVQEARWQQRLKTGFDPSAIKIPKRFKEVVTSKGSIDAAYLNALREAYAKEIVALAGGVPTPAKADVS